MNCQFRSGHPNQSWDSDLTYVSTRDGWLFVTFVVGVSAWGSVGSRVTRSMQADVVLDALEQARYAGRPRVDGTVTHRGDSESQYVSMHQTGHLAAAGIEPNVRSRWDGLGNALA